MKKLVFSPFRDGMDRLFPYLELTLPAGVTSELLFFGQ